MMKNFGIGEFEINQETHVQDLTSLLVAASSLRAKWVANLKHETTIVDSSPKRKHYARIKGDDRLFDSSDKSVELPAGNLRLLSERNFSGEEQSLNSSPALFDDLCSNKNLNLGLHGTNGSAECHLLPICPGRDSEQERLRNTEACLFKAQSDLVHLRETNRLAKAKLAVDFENRIILEKSLAKQEQVTLEAELCSTREEVKRLQSALAAAKNQALMVELSTTQPAFPTNNHSSESRFHRKFPTNKSSFTSSQPCKCNQLRSQGEVRALEEVAGLHNELEIAHEAKAFAEQELKKSGETVSRLMHENDEMSSSKKILETKLNMEILRAEAAEYAMNDQNNQNVGEIVPQNPYSDEQILRTREFNSALNHEVDLIEILTRDIQKYRIASFQNLQENLSGLLYRAETLKLTDVEEKLDNIIDHLTQTFGANAKLKTMLESALFQRVDKAATSMTQRERSLQSINIPTSEEDQKYALLEAEFASLKSSFSKQVTGLSQEHEQLHCDLTLQLSKERMEKQSFLAMLDEAKARIKDLECELIELISKMQESNRANHDDYTYVETLRQECSSLIKENSRLKMEVMQLERALASEQQRPTHLNRIDPVASASLLPASELLVADLQQEVSKVTQQLVSENNRLILILKDRDDQLLALKKAVSEKHQDTISPNPFPFPPVTESHGPVDSDQEDSIRYPHGFEKLERSMVTDSSFQEKNPADPFQQFSESSASPVPPESFELTHTSYVVFPDFDTIKTNEFAPNYSGESIEEHPHGKGIQIWPDGRIYDGSWKRGVFNGLGTYIWWNGDIYEGDWLNGCAHGLGSYTFASGNFYEGEFQRNRFHGVGALHHRNGWRCRGYWSQGVMDGWSMLISPSGKKQMLYCKNGVLATMTLGEDRELGHMLIRVGEVITSARKTREQIRREQGRDLESILDLETASSLASLRMAAPESASPARPRLGIPPPPPPPSPPQRPQKHEGVGANVATSKLFLSAIM